MKLFEADNCGLHEVQQRTVKVQCQHVESRFQVCPCGGKLDMTDDMRSRTRRKFRELIENSYCMPFQKKRGSKHVLPFQEHQLEPKN